MRLALCSTSRKVLRRRTTKRRVIALASTAMCFAGTVAAAGIPGASAAAASPTVVGSASTPDGQGSWMVTSDGHIAVSGDAGYYGSLATDHLNQPIVGMASTPDGHGYRLVASDGGVFTFGDAAFQGSAVGAGQRAVGIMATSGGYAVALADLQVLQYDSTSSGASAASSPSLPAAPSAPAPAPPPVTTGTPGSASPSGEALPTTAPAGFHPLWSDDFNGPALNTSLWYPYSGQPGGDPLAWWNPNHVTVSGGELHLSTYQDHKGGTNSTGWVSGGVGSTQPQTYGAFEVRMRVDSGPGLSAIALLWPTVGWPPEVDFYEDAPQGTARNSMSATLHFDPNNDQIQKSLAGIDFTQWHTIGVQWTPGQLVYTIDGAVWATVTSSNVPDVPMSLDLQTQVVPVSGMTAPMASNVNMDVDWVAAYGMN